MYKATKLLSSSSFPIQGDLRLTFLGMLAFLQQHRQQSNQHAIIDAIYNKLEIYWNQHLSNSSSISAILDPHYKTTTFNNSVERDDCINHLQSLFYFLHIWQILILYQIEQEQQLHKIQGIIC